MNDQWTIGEIAKLFDISTDTLRYYEKAGLLSAHRNVSNRYRGYSYDDLVILMDILFFRNMEIAVKDIRQILTSMDVSEIKGILQQNQRIVEDKIQELVQQSKLLAQVAAHYELCEQRLGSFSIVPAPAFKCKFLGNQADDLIATIRKYKKPERSWMNSIRYTLLLPQDELLRNPSFHAAQFGISFDDDALGLLDCSEQREFSSLSETDCLYTIVGTDYSKRENEVLSKAWDWVQEQGRRVKGPLIGRYLASAHKDGLDFYEIWIALHST